MKVLLEKLENLVAEFKEKLQEPVENKVQLSELKPGDVIKTSFGELIVLEQLDDETMLITKEFVKENVVFDSNSPYFNTSEIEKLLSGEICELFEKEFGSENVLTNEVDLTTVDGQKFYGSYMGKIRLLTFDEAREYNDLLVHESIDDWYWTMTPWSVPGRGWDKSVAVVSPSGNVNLSSCCYNCGVRPICILKSNIFVSKKNEQEEK